MATHDRLPQQESDCLQEAGIPEWIPAWTTTQIHADLFPEWSDHFQKINTYYMFTHDREKQTTHRRKNSRCLYYEDSFLVNRNERNRWPHGTSSRCIKQGWKLNHNVDWLRKHQWYGHLDNRISKNIKMA